MILDIRRQISQRQTSHGVSSSGVAGHGIYLVEIARLQMLRDQMGESLEYHCFTDRERKNPFSGKRRLHFLAGHLAGKNAVVGAIGQDRVPENSWQSIDIQNLSNGQLLVVLNGEVRNIADQRGIKTWMLSISHTPSYALASAIALSST